MFKLYRRRGGTSTAAGYHLVIHQEENMSAKRSKCSEQGSSICEFCKLVIKPGTGGCARIPTVISNLPERDVPLHSACLNPYINWIEKHRPPLTHIFPAPESKSR